MSWDITDVRDLLNIIKADVMGWINQAITSAVFGDISLGNVAYLDRINTFSQYNTFSNGSRVSEGGLVVGDLAEANIAGRIINIEDTETISGSGIGVRFRNKSSSPDKTYAILATNSGDLVIQDDSDAAPAIYLRPTNDRVTIVSDNLMFVRTGEPAIPTGGKPIFVFEKISGTPGGMGTVAAGLFAGTAGTVCTMAVIDSSNVVRNLRDMVGASASVAGTAGFVPAPAAGDEGKFLRGDGSWQTASSSGTAAMNYISEQTASNSASLAFTSGVDSTYRYYIIILRNIKPATDGANLILTMSTDGGSTYLASTGYKYGLFRVTNDAATGARGSTGTSSIELADNLGNGAAEALDGEIRLWNMPSTTNQKSVSIDTTWEDAASDRFRSTGGGANTTTSAVNAVKLAMSSGNIASGTATLYGVL